MEFMRKQEKTVLIVAGIDMISIVVKIVLASITGSLSLLADAWHSISDLITSIMVFLALVFDRREKEKSSKSSEGKARFIRRSSWEPRVCAFIGIVLIAVAANVFKKVYSTETLEIIKHPMIASLIILFLILLSYIRFKFEESVGQETDSPALIADAYHSRVDIYVLLLVLISFAAEMVDLRIDRWVAAYIALLILYIAIKTIYRSLTMMFRLSSTTDPEDRAVEDTVILLMMGGINFSKNHLFGWFNKRLYMVDEKKRYKLFRLTKWGASLFLVVFWVSTGVYTVKPSEVAIVERFGQPINLDSPVGPGIHCEWPYPISKIRRVDVHTARRMRLGYQTKERKDLILWTNIHYIKEFSVLSGDGAIIDLAANLHFYVSDPALFLYSTHNSIDCLEMLSNQVLRETAGTCRLFELLTYDRDISEEQIKQKLQKLVDELQLGVKILQLCFLDVHPPISVAPAFEDVISAQEDMETYVEQARGYGKEMLPLASAEAYTQQIQAQAYKFDLQLKANGRAKAFKARNTAFKLHESVNRYRMRMETLGLWLQDKNLWLVDSAAVDNPLDIFVSPGGNMESTSGLIQPGIGGETFEQ
ncbi:protease modulator HflK family protein [bacterium]|nr:protease modulator HflK family protein [bacterium]